MVQFTTILAACSLLALCSADRKDKQQPEGLSRIPVPATPAVKPRSLAERQTCSGSCSTCFGSGYILCPSSTLYCYLPGDATYGLTSCPGSSSADSVSSAAAAPTTTGSAGDSDFCSGKGATCISCFGPGYLECSDGINCYNPADPNYDTCPTGTSSSSGSSSSSSSASCAEQFGTGNINCGTDACYNPDDGESCCAGGYYCREGYTCGEQTGKCDKSSGVLTSLLGDDSTTTRTSTGSSTFSTSNLSGGGSGSSSSGSGSGSSSDDSTSAAAGVGFGFGGVLGGAVGAVGVFVVLVAAL